MTARSAVVIGSTSIDLVAPNRGSRSANAAAGNSGSNIAIRLAAAGWEVAFVTTVGDDAAGDLVRRDCERWGVDTSGFVVDQDYPTPRVFIVSDGVTASELLFRCPRCGSRRSHPLRVPTADQLSDGVLARSSDAVLIVVDVPGSGAARIARQGRDALVWYEASLFEASPADQRDVAESSDVVKCSSDEYDHYRELFADPARRTEITMVTEGSRGVTARLRSAANWTTYRISSAPVQPVDTIGAGDAFTAVCAAALARDGVRGAGAGGGSGTDEARARILLDAVDAGQHAAAVACLAVGARGDMSLVTRSGRRLEPWIATDLSFCCARCESAESASIDGAVPAGT
jgi:sugar/nucleoside kinase (ribokinase family)